MPTPFITLLHSLADEDPDRPAITCEGETITRAELEMRSNRLARAYERLGVHEGDFVTIALPNSVEFLVAVVAVWKLGATPQPVSHRLPARELEAIIELAEPALVLGATVEGRTCVQENFEPATTVPADPIEPGRISRAWKAPTSGGSTGRPKLIVSGGRAEIDPLPGSYYGMRPNGVELVPGPLYHNAPFTFSALGLLNGNHIVMLTRFDAVAALEAIERHRVDWVNFVPTMMLRIHRVMEEEPRRYDISSLQTVWHMAAPCPTWLKAAWIDLVGAEKVMELYGGTEGQAMTVINGAEWLEHRGSVGRPVLGEMKVVDAGFNDLPPGDVGEIFLRRSADAAPTYRYIGAEARERDGWESLGDLGWMDADGYLYLSDRRTDMILAGGANIYPAEVEAALMEHPQVGTAAVVGLPDEDLGQRVHAVVQTDGELTADELVTFLGERLVRYKIPRSFRFVTEPLRDDAGKARRTAIRDQEIELMQSR